MQKHRKKKIILYFLLLLLIYLIIGASAPFSKYQDITEKTKQEFKAEVYYSEQEGCDRAMLLETNQSAWEERIRLLNSAEESIILSTYDMRDGESTRDILSVIFSKAKEGVTVQIIVDGISGLIRMDGKEVFKAISSHPQIEIKLYNKINLLEPWKTQGRMHDKYVIVDDKAYILGGRNTFDYFLGEYNLSDQSLDREIFIFNANNGTNDSKDSSVYQMKDYFEKVWSSQNTTQFYEEESLRNKPKIQEEILQLEKRYEGIKENYPELWNTYHYEENTVPTNRVSLISGQTEIFAKEPIVFYQIAELMKQAKQKVRIHTPYAVTNSYMNDTLTELKRAVPDTKIILNSVENGDNFVASSDYLYNKQKLIDTGIGLYEYDGGISNHGKSILIDEDISMIGSYNLDLRSTYVNTELVLVIQSKELNQQLEQNMDKLETDCRRVLDRNTYEAPSHLQIKELTPVKRTALRIVGFVMQGFRYLI